MTDDAIFLFDKWLGITFAVIIISLMIMIAYCSFKTKRKN